MNNGIRAQKCVDEYERVFVLSTKSSMFKGMKVEVGLGTLGTADHSWESNQLALLVRAAGAGGLLSILCCIPSIAQ